MNVVALSGRSVSKPHFYASTTGLNEKALRCEGVTASTNDGGIAPRSGGGRNSSAWKRRTINSTSILLYMGIKIQRLENDGGAHMCVGLRAKVVNIENNMVVIDAGGVKRKVSAELI